MPTLSTKETPLAAPLAHCSLLLGLLCHFLLSSLILWAPGVASQSSDTPQCETTLTTHTPCLLHIGHLLVSPIDSYPSLPGHQTGVHNRTVSKSKPPCLLIPSAPSFLQPERGNLGLTLGVSHTLLLLQHLLPTPLPNASRIFCPSFSRRTTATFHQESLYLAPAQPHSNQEHRKTQFRGGHTCGHTLQRLLSHWIKA